LGFFGGEYFLSVVNILLEGALEHGDLEQQALSFIDRFLAAHDQTRDAMRAEGATLADRLQAAAFALSMARATEFSPNIPLYTLLAAKVALLA